MLRRSFMGIWASGAVAALVGCTGTQRRAQPGAPLDLEPMDRSQKVVLISRIKPKPGAEREIESAIRAFYVDVRRAEPGCLVNAMHRKAGPPRDPKADPTGAFALADDAPAVLVFYEVYRDQEAARQHTNTAHFRTLMTRIGNLIDGSIELEFLQELDSVDRAGERIGRLQADAFDSRSRGRAW